MATLVVGGGAKDIGKTSLVCGVISALRGYCWTAVKVTAHDYEAGDASRLERDSAQQLIQEETRPGTETDTARYLQAGAVRALLVKRQGNFIPMADLATALGNDRNVIFESNRIIDCIRPDVCLALLGGEVLDVKPSFLRLLEAADAIVCVGDDIRFADARTGIPKFIVESPQVVPRELVRWLKQRLPEPR